MRKLFVSYARENKPDVDQLVEHLATMGYETWVDAALRGGQDWWDEILARIADCDVIIAIYSSAALNSTACGREFEWAVALGKPIIPVAVEPPPSALPSRFARRQIIDYSTPADRPLAALKLQGALATQPAAPPLPDPLPEPPKAPLSYLTDLIDTISQAGAIDHDQQHQILRQLEPALTSLDPLERRGGSDILERFSRRSDLYADVDRAITRLRQLAEQPAPVDDIPETPPEQRPDIGVVEKVGETTKRVSPPAALIAPPKSVSANDTHERPRPVAGPGDNPLNVPAILVMTFAALGLLAYWIDKSMGWLYSPIVHYWTGNALLNEIRNLLLAGAFWFLHRRISADQDATAAAKITLIGSIVVAGCAGADLVWRLIGGAASRTYLASTQTSVNALFFAAIVAAALAASKPRQLWCWVLAIGGVIGLVRVLLMHSWSGYPTVLADFVYVVYLIVVLVAGILMYRQRQVPDSPE